MPYKLTLHTKPVERTTWWKDENHPEPANVWWLEGHGLNRPATDVEVDLWQQHLAAQERAVKMAEVYDGLILSGFTIGDRLRAIFGMAPKDERYRTQMPRLDQQVEAITKI
jgi:hypothetical protein